MDINGRLQQIHLIKLSNLNALKLLKASPVQQNLIWSVLNLLLPCDACFIPWPAPGSRPLLAISLKG